MTACQHRLAGPTAKLAKRAKMAPVGFVRSSSTTGLGTPAVGTRREPARRAYAENPFARRLDWPENEAGSDLAPSNIEFPFWNEPADIRAKVAIRGTRATYMGSGL